MRHEDGFMICSICGAANWPDGSWWLAGATANQPPPCSGERAGQRQWINRARYVPMDDIDTLWAAARRKKKQQG
jgi:hypothetical protein